ncbi:MAG: hypothetical protein R8G66_05205 [Cytophagales bacterium]|nr:hypothetical protein [Cytophagales bacterium]
MSVNIISHKGKSIVQADYSVCTNQEELLAKHLEVEQVIRKQGKEVLTLVDVTGTSLNSEFMAAAKDLARRTLNDHVPKGAILGVTGLKKALLLGFNVVATIKWLPFDTQEEAMDYLIE